MGISYCGQLNGLDGVKQESVKVRSFRRVSEAMRFLKEDRATITGRDNGAISLWIDDAGKYHCESFRRYSSLDHQIFWKKEDVRLWLKDWIERIK